MKWRILISAPYLQPVIDEYRQVFDAHQAEIVLPEVYERLTELQLLDLIGDIDGVVAGDDQFTRKVLEKAAPRLKVISKWGTGVDSFDHDACREMGVAIRNTPDAFIDPVADSVMGYLLCFARRLPWMDAQMKNGLWDKIPGKALNETTLGIIGVGRIGKAVARRARSFGVRLLGFDLVEMPTEFIAETGMDMADKEILLQSSDFISLNCDLNPTSYHLIGAAEFAMMRSSAVVINLARGPIVDELALVSALQNQALAGAALDVFEDEPLPQGSPLRAMGNVMLAPHNSNSSPRAWQRVHESTLQNLFDTLEGGMA